MEGPSDSGDGAPHHVPHLSLVARQQCLGWEGGVEGGCGSPEPTPLS